MTEQLDVAVIGAGIYGLMTAHRLLTMGVRKVAVFEMNYIGSGQSSRNAGGIRAQFANPHTIKFMVAAENEWRRMTRELGYNFLFTQDGYLFSCYDDEDTELYALHRKLQNENGVKSVWLEPDAVAEHVPGINMEGLAGANFHSLDGILHHDAVISGLIFSIRRNGGKIYEYTPVGKVEIGHDGKATLRTPNGNFQADYVVNATAAYAPGIASGLGISLPIKPVRRELVATEPLRFFMKPMLVSLKYGITIHQSLRGEFIGHTSIAEPENFDLKASFAFMVKYARDITKLLPFMKNVRIVRQWAGTYDMTPDNSPVLGPAPSIPNFINAAGSSGHGFMLAPAVGKFIAEYITTGKVNELMRPFSLERFEKGEPLTELVLSHRGVL